MKILFLCTGNSCRSQMAEGWTRALKGDSIQVWSAGIEKHGLDPLAVQVMAEAGVDIAQQRSKLLEELDESDFDFVVTVCDNARESCPLFPGHAKIVHRSFPDPPTLVRNTVDEEEKLARYREVRDQIRSFVEALPDVLYDADNG